MYVVTFEWPSHRFRKVGKGEFYLKPPYAHMRLSQPDKICVEALPINYIYYMYIHTLGTSKCTKESFKNITL